MALDSARNVPRNILVVIPNWVGDVVLASPVLAALRIHFESSRIAYLLRPYVREILAGSGWSDAEIDWPTERGIAAVPATLRLAASLRDQRFDLVLLLTNSFRSALVTCLARIPRRVGFARDGRSWLLTDRVRPVTRNGDFVPVSVLDSYIQLAEQIGCPTPDRRPRLVIAPEQAAAGDELKHAYGLNGRPRYAVINPGAAFGAAKCWPPDRFAALCDRLHAELGLTCVIVGAAGEAALMQHIATTATSKPVCCNSPGTTLGSLKPLIRDAALLVCNDTGPRHYGIAFGVPVVTIFGPTHQAWTQTGYPHETRLQLKVECGPCQLRTCPLDHRCMTGITVDMVMTAIREQLSTARSCSQHT